MSESVYTINKRRQWLQTLSDCISTQGCQEDFTNAFWEQVKKYEY